MSVVNMSLTRAFTTRRVKGSEEHSVPQRSNTSAKISGAAALRNKISAPVELLHTTNMLSYNAPDIHPQSALSSASSTKSDDDLSDAGANYTTASSPPTSPDVPANRDSASPEPNHLSCYFTPPSQKPTAATTAAATKTPTPAVTKTAVTPVIPSRAASHTKKASYEALTRARSNSRLSEQSSRTVSSKASFTFSRSSSSSTSTSTTSHNSMSASPQNLTSKASTASLHSTPPVPAMPTAQTTTTPSQKYHHPFGKELAQVTEIAEEYGVRERLNIVEAEEKELAAKGLLKFSPEDYLGEIQALFSTMFFTEAKTMAPIRPIVPKVMPEAVWI